MVMVSAHVKGVGGPRLRIEEARGRKSLQVQEDESEKESQNTTGWTVLPNTKS